MTVLKLTAERPPRILLPARIADQRTVGELKGYYVRNTNSYNVPPVDPAAQVDPQRVDSIGYLLPLNPFDCIREELRPQLRRLETGEVASGDIAGGLRSKASGTLRSLRGSMPRSWRRKPQISSPVSNRR